MALQIQTKGSIGITSDLPFVTGAMSCYPYSEMLKAQFTFLSTFGDTVCGALPDGKTLWVPREAVPYAKPPCDHRTFQPLSAINCTTPEWRPEQEVLCKQSLNLLQMGRNHLFEAPTGWGKTIAGSWVAAMLGQRTLIICTKDDLMDQWRDTLINILKIPSNQIGHVQGDVADWKGKQFVLGMGQSIMIEGKYPMEFYQNFGLVILDEVHTMAAECFIRNVQSFYAKYRLGLSATPERKDGKTKLLHWHIGPTLVRGKVIAMKPRVLVRQTGWKIPARRTLEGNAWVMKEMPYTPGRMTPVISVLAKNDIRNMEIVHFMKQVYAHPTRVGLIMSDLRDHLNRLFQMLTGEGIPGNEIGFYVGGMHKADLASTKKRRVVLATYKMCATGTNVPHWDTLVLATPKADVKQAIGRVLRAHEGKQEPVILDLVDHSSIFQSFHKSRMKQYYEAGVSQIVRVA